MNEDAELQQLSYVRNAITLDQAMWQIDPVESGRVGLVRYRQITDYVRAEASVELVDGLSQPHFLVRGVVIDCHDPVQLRAVRCTSGSEAGEAATAMLRWVLRAGHAIAARTLEVL
jgi:hypothetical protein